METPVKEGELEKPAIAPKMEKVQELSRDDPGFWIEYGKKQVIGLKPLFVAVPAQNI